MKITTIPYSENGAYTVFKADDIEFSNPVEYFFKSTIQMLVAMEKRILSAPKNLPYPIDWFDGVLRKRALQDWQEQYDELMKIEIPPSFFSLLTSTSKKDQLKLLRGQAITSDQFRSYIMKAWIDYGFSFSQYSAEYHHAGLDSADLPKVVVVNGNRVETVGNTNLTQGQLKQAVKHRRVTISKFLDKGDSWHCFFITFKSLRGEETWKDGQPHFHYISDKFGLRREDVVHQLKSRNYNLGTLPHIDFIR